MLSGCESTLIDTPKTTHILVLMCIVVAAEAQHVRVIDKDNLWFPIPRNVLNSKRSFSTVSFSQHTMISLMIRPALNQTLSWRPVKHSKPMYNVARIEGMGTLPAPRREEETCGASGAQEKGGGDPTGKMHNATRDRTASGQREEARWPTRSSRELGGRERGRPQGAHLATEGGGGTVRGGGSKGGAGGREDVLEARTTRRRPRGDTPGPATGGHGIGPPRNREGREGRRRLERRAGAEGRRTVEETE